MLVFGRLVGGGVDEGTNWTRLRLMPAPNMRWSLSGTMYVSSSLSAILFADV